ncbi:MAG TPA: ComEC/Rec2 family competence protein [Nocardioides sp.]
MPALDLGLPSVEIRDLRMAAAGAAAWLGGLGGLLAPRATLLAGVVAGLLALVIAGRPGMRRAIAAWLLVALAVGTSAVLRDMSVGSGPVATLAPMRSAVDARITITSDPREVSGQFSTSVVMRAVVTDVSAHGTSYAVHTPVLVIADETWSGTRLGSSLHLRGRLASADGHDVAAVFTPLTAPVRVEQPSVLWRGSGTVRSSIRAAVSHRPMPERALVPALVDGDDTSMPDEIAEEFRTTGLTHLLAVSGTNLTLVVGFLLIVGRWCGVRGRWQYVLGALGIIGFILLARTEPSVVRAAAMGTVALIGMGSNGTGRGIRCLGVAVVGLLVWDPWLCTTIGFALSVLATSGILLLGPGWSRALANWMPMPAAQAIAVPTAAQLACTPIVAAISGQVSLVAVLANLLAAPLVAPATVLGLLGGLIGLVWVPAGRLCGWVACWCAWGIITVADRCARLSLPAIDWGTTVVPVALLTVLCLGLAVTLGPVFARRWSGFSCCVVMVLVVVVPLPSPHWPPRGWVMAVCDVGQGDAVVLNAGGGRGVLVDAGPDPGLVDKCLSRLDVEALPLVVLTHFHADHVDGLPGALAGRGIGEVLVSALPEPPERYRSVLEATRGKVRVPALGEVRRVGQVTLQVVGPTPGVVFRDDPNNSSIVLVAEVDDIRILLTGDEEPEAQKAFMKTWPGLRIDVLKIPHHGSRYQDMRHLLSLDASVAIASLGADNDYGHPAPSTMDPLAESGAAIFRTDRDGDVLVLRDGEGVKVRTRD